jgi:hypothetical protein
VTYRFYNHDETLIGDINAPAPLAMLDFWRWAFSDLLEDTLKGLYTEWMVGHLLGLPMRHGGRPGYGNYDLSTASGIRIEVKSSAYWQSWKLRREDGTPRPADEIERWRPTAATQVRFSNLRARDAVDRTKQASAYKSDLYVFCFQCELDPLGWNALDLAQWEFHLLGRSELEALGVSSLSLKKLRMLTPRLTARDLQREGRKRLAELEEHSTK